MYMYNVMYKPCDLDILIRLERFKVTQQDKPMKAHHRNTARNHSTSYLQGALLDWFHQMESGQSWNCDGSAIAFSELN